MIWEVVLHAVVNLREVVRGPKPSQSLRCTLRVTPSPDPCHATFHQERNERLRLLLEGGSCSSCRPVHLRGAGKVAEIRGHQHLDVFHGRESCNFLLS
jgi:hypothetical protein